MAAGITDKVAIIGFGTVRGGELLDKGADDILLESAMMALGEAGLEVKDIQAAWVGVLYSGLGGSLGRVLKSGSTSVSRVLNDTATGADAFRNGCLAVAAGLYDIVMVAGAEKLKDEGITGLPRGGLRALATEHEGTPAAMASALATRYMHKYGVSYEDMKRVLGHIAIKNYQNGSKNPFAFLQRTVTFEEYLAAPMVAWPLGEHDVCEYVDGAAVAIVATPEVARQLRDRYALLKGIGSATSDGLRELTGELTALPMNTIAAQAAYAMAGVKDPAKEIDEYNVHDASTIVELLCYESLGLCPAGLGHKLTLDGVFDAAGAMPVNTDGGIKCIGDTVGVTGLRSLYEPYLQVTGQAGPRQLKNVRLTAAQAQAQAEAWSSIVSVLGARD